MTVAELKLSFQSDPDLQQILPAVALARGFILSDGSKFRIATAGITHNDILQRYGISLAQYLLELECIRKVGPRLYVLGLPDRLAAGTSPLKAIIENEITLSVHNPADRFEVCIVSGNSRLIANFTYQDFVDNAFKLRDPLLRQRIFS